MRAPAAAAAPAPRARQRALQALAGAAPRPETVFLLIGLVAGLLFAFVTPPLRGADEAAHWYRAYQLSEGAILAQRMEDRVGGALPRSAQLRPAASPSQAVGTAEDVPSPDDRAFVDFRNTAVYSPVAYLPQALIIAAGRALGLPPPALFFAARLTGLATALGLIFFAIRIIPIAKHVFVLLALTPMAIRQMSVLSADTVTNATALLLLALCVRLALRPGAVATAAQIARVLLCSVAVSLAKIAYLPLAGLILLGSAERVGRRRAIAFVLVIGANLMAVGGWLWLARVGYAAQRIAPDADPPRQLAFVLGDPLRYALLLLDDLHRHWRVYLAGCTGFTSVFPPALGPLHLGLVALVAALDGRADAAIDGRGRWILAAVAVSTYALINTLNYLGWNPVGASAISFVQGRYYIPILPLPFLMLSNRRLAGVLSERRLTAVAACAGVLVAGFAVRALLLRWQGS